MGQAQAKVSIIIEVGPGHGVRRLPGRISCRAVAERMYWPGYRNVRVADCRASVYRYAARKAGSRWLVNMSSCNGRVIGVQRIRC